MHLGSIQVSALILIASIASQTQAGTTTAAYDFQVDNTTGSYGFTLGVFAPFMEGWEVSFNTDARITHLGIYDTGIEALTTNYGDPGIAADVTLGVWNQHGELLGQAVIPAGDSAPLFNDYYRYVELPSIEVSAGDHLIFARLSEVGAWDIVTDTGDIEARLTFVSPQLDVEFSGDLSYVGRRYNLMGDDSLTFPTILETGFSPLGAGNVNFLYESVPAPGTIALLAGAGLSLTGRRRNRAE